MAFRYGTATPITSITSCCLASSEDHASQIRNCTFIDNQAASGAGVAITGFGEFFGAAIVANCEFTANDSNSAALWLFNATNSRVMNCSFVKNTSAGGEAAIGLYGNVDEAIFSNCKFVANSTTDTFTAAGAMHLNANASPDSIHLVNCTFWGNSAPVGNNTAGAIYVFSSSEIVLRNSIIWQNGATQIAHNGGMENFTIDYSCLQTQGGFYPWSGEGTGNITVDPMLVDPDGADNVLGTADDKLMLACGSPCIDAASNTAVSADSADLDGDSNTTEPTPFDLGGQSRFIDDPGTTDTGAGTAPIVDMGAYEYQVVPCPGNIVGNCAVDIDDLLAVINGWGACPTPCPPACSGDINSSCAVDVDDLLIVINGWGPCPTAIGDTEDMPTSIQDCMDICSERHPEGGAAWSECTNQCIEGLCQAQIIDCD